MKQDWILKTVTVIWLILLGWTLRGSDIACADVNVEVLADAIYLAEGGAKTNHPYGILKKYVHTSPRQACINTIKHALRDWHTQIEYTTNPDDFIRYLGIRYAPIFADNDPTNLNKNWVTNVTWNYNNMWMRSHDNDHLEEIK